ncbi:uncharacterized protein C19orf44 homolog isoform X2 [Electrophorus electricus]|uniref:uncharacterized protein C19orf44 homolog isoform X2 n=1 Tax=Electrophorus electricus TaxID=8005 RepID=UPI0015CFB8AB|nr:uncharacterized protein C19orf44 homolog isoform X2 [Electrophorus electricus]
MLMIGLHKLPYVFAMWHRGGIRSAALERAKAQLSGQRLLSSEISKANRRRDVANFGNGLLQTRQTPFQDLSDLSSEDPESENQDYLTVPAKVSPYSAEPLERFDVGGGSRFLKKSAVDASADIRSSTPGTTTADKSDPKLVLWHRPQSVALSRLAMIEERFRNHKNKKPGLDADTDLPLPHESGLSASSSSVPSMAGSRFLKKKSLTLNDQKDPDTKPMDARVTIASIASRVEKGVSLDSDEEDMRILLGESLDLPDGNRNKVMRQTETSPQMAVKIYMKTSEKVANAVPSAENHEEKFPVSSAFTDRHHKTPSLSPPSSPKIPSARRPVSRRAGVTHLSLSSSSGHSEIRTLDELFSVASNNDDTLSEKSVILDDFQLNVLTLDDLAPVFLGTAEVSKEKDEASPHESRHPSLSSAKEISHVPEDTPGEYKSDFESETHNETAISANEISEHLSGRYERSSLATEPQSLSLEVRDDDDRVPSEELTSVHYSKSESCLTLSDGSHFSFHTSDAIIPHSEPHSPTARRTMKDATVQTQTDSLTHTWSFGQGVLGPSAGMSYMDPAPLASHTVSAEAVEALSTYRPAVFALNDMLRQQLALTRNFIESSRHLHQATVEALGPADYRYTTLEETKEFIRYNRSPRLTVEDALAEVLQEMRDYHYI